MWIFLFDWNGIQYHLCSTVGRDGFNLEIMARLVQSYLSTATTPPRLPRPMHTHTHMRGGSHHSTGHHIIYLLGARETQVSNAISQDKPFFPTSEKLIQCFSISKSHLRQPTRWHNDNKAELLQEPGTVDLDSVFSLSTSLPSRKW